MLQLQLQSPLLLPLQLPKSKLKLIVWNLSGHLTQFPAKSKAERAKQLSFPHFVAKFWSQPWRLQQFSLLQPLTWVYEFLCINWTLFCFSWPLCLCVLLVTVGAINLHLVQKHFALEALNKINSSSQTKCLNALGTECENICNMQLWHANTDNGPAPRYVYTNTCYSQLQWPVVYGCGF